jgi:hypothetical protein
LKKTGAALPRSVGSHSLGLDSIDEGEERLAPRDLLGRCVVVASARVAFEVHPPLRGGVAVLLVVGFVRDDEACEVPARGRRAEHLGGVGRVGLGADEFLAEYVNELLARENGSELRHHEGRDSTTA